MNATVARRVTECAPVKSALRGCPRHTPPQGVAVQQHIMMAVRSLSVRPGAAARGDTAPLPAARATTHASSPGLRRQDAPTSSSASSRVRALLLARRAGVAAAAAAVAAAVHPHQLLRTLTGGGGAGGSGAGGGSGGSGGGGGGHGRWFGEQAAWAESDYFDEDDDDSRRGPKAPGTPAASSPDDEEKFLCEAVKANNLPTGPGIPSKVCALAGLDPHARIRTLRHPRHYSSSGSMAPHSAVLRTSTRRLWRPEGGTQPRSRCRVSPSVNSPRMHVAPSCL